MSYVCVTSTQTEEPSMASTPETAPPMVPSSCFSLPHCHQRAAFLTSDCTFILSVFVLYTNRILVCILACLAACVTCVGCVRVAVFRSPCCVVFHCVIIPHVTYPFCCCWVFGWCPVLPIADYAAISILVYMFW